MTGMTLTISILLGVVLGILMIAFPLAPKRDRVLLIVAGIIIIGLVILNALVLA